jgi:hypothetical protein
MWEVDLGLIEGWLDTLDDETVTDIFYAVERLQQVGPTLGRPLVDTITGSRLKNMKELRPPSPKDSEIRILFAFDPRRMAIMLVGGDKASGKNRKAKWSGWYRTAIPEAERLYEEHLKGLGGD